MSDVDPRVAGAIETLALPLPAERLRVREVVLARLADGPAGLAELVGAAFDDAGLPPNTTQEPVELSARDAVGEVSADHVGLHRRRVSRAIAEVLDELAALGIVTRLSEAPDAQQERHGVTWPGRGDSVPVPWLAPEPSAKGYRLALLYQDDTSVVLQPLDPSLYLDGLEPLLGPRGLRCAHEALTAWRRRLYLASVNLIGAASEAAWYGLGELLRNGDDQLGRAVDEDRTARVIQLAGQRLQEKGVTATDVSEFVTHGTYLRQLRNYGAHPRFQRDPDLEATFTEAVSAVLLTSTRRYFVRLTQAAARAGVRL